MFLKMKNKVIHSNKKMGVFIAKLMIYFFMNWTKYKIMKFTFLMGIAKIFVTDIKKFRRCQYRKR